VLRDLIQNTNQKHKENTKRMALNVKPLGDRILVEAAEEKEQKKGGIIIPIAGSNINWPSISLFDISITQRI
jgi:hypothetical protein